MTSDALFSGITPPVRQLAGAGSLTILAVAGLWFLHRHLTRPSSGISRSVRDQTLLFLAEGFGSGLLRPGPGTWGSIVGLGWFLLLLFTAHPGWISVIIGVSALASIPVCAAAERSLGRQDPGSVVLDEIVAVPLVFLPWLWVEWTRHQQVPTPGELVTFEGLMRLSVGFAWFRLLDIWKPWPIRPSQRLPGGWGVVVDDLLAGAIAGGLLLLWPR